MPDLQLAVAVRTARAALQAGDLLRAEQICRGILAGKPRMPDVLIMLGVALDRRGESAEAAEVLQRAAKLRRPDAELHMVIGRTLINAGDFQGATEQLDEALRLAPDHVLATASKADVLERLGRLDEAEGALRSMIEQGRETAEIGLIQCRIALARRQHDEAIAIARHHILAGADDGHRRQLLFVLGKALERTGEIDEAFEAYRTGNEILRQPFDCADHVARTNGIIATWSDRRMALLPRLDPLEDGPVFIVGMFRSGSTLVETIIDAHPDAAGAGESQLIRQLSEGLMVSVDPNDPYVRNIHELKSADLMGLRTAYLEGIAKLAPPARCVVDKSLGNYMQLGLMTAVFGKPRVIHCRRNAADTCFSCYAEHLSPRQAYTTDLHALGVVHREYERLMEHWRKTIDIPMLEVDYEAVVADPESLTRRILDFCGLPFDEACLRFHTSDRVAHTSSYAQIRQPIYKTAVSRAERFKRHLGPLFEALG